MSNCNCDDCNMIAVKHARVLGYEPNGSRTERSTRDALAELGAFVEDTLRNPPMRAGTAGPYFFVPDAYDAIRDAAIRLGLITKEAPRG
jgi:hypothetical protein